MKRFLLLAGLIAALFLPSLNLKAQDDQYLRIYTLIQEGDTFKNSGQTAPALEKYLEAQTALQSFQRVYPVWNTKVVGYRLNYLASSIAEMSGRTPAPKTDAKEIPASAAAPPVPASDSGSQLNDLQNQLRQLQSDNAVLEAKLKESLAAQPALVDSRELSRAQQQVRSLQKENDLLKVTLSQAPARTAPTVDPAALEQMKRQLADSNRQLAEQTTKANDLVQEKAELQNKLKSLIPAPWNATNLDTTRKALDDTSRQLAIQTSLATQLALEKTVLQNRVKTLMTENETASALRAENEILKKQVADLKAQPGNPQDASRQLAEATAQLAALQSEKEILRLENTALENRVKKLSGRTIAAGTIVLPDSSTDAAGRVKQLERERDELQKKLDAAQKELYGRSSKDTAGKVEELNGQVEILRTRLGVFEAQQVPYTAAELALFNQLAVQIADPRAGKVSTKELPPGTVTLVAEAQRDFAARNYEQAEAKYLQVLSQDEKNVYTLANLAAIQLETGHLDESEKHIRQALAVAPTDVYSLSILGFLKFRQQQYDEALDVLGRAAKLDPKNAEIQNYLGLTLSHKGMRGPAETALRKAIQLDPNYATAHYNLAVVYITQKPPGLALARWHYQKARAAGLPANADLEKMLDDSKAAETAP